MNNFQSSLGSNDLISFSFYNIDFEEANREFLSSKLSFDTLSNEKKTLEISTQYKKARARMVW